MISAAEHNFGVAWGMMLRRLELERDTREVVRLAVFPEHMFHPTRKWRFDFAWPLHKVALEIDGLGKTVRGEPKNVRDVAKFKAAALGGHRTPDGMRKDHEKQNEAAILGWRVMRVLAADKARAHEWAAMVLRALEAT